MNAVYEPTTKKILYYCTADYCPSDLSIYINCPDGMSHIIDGVPVYIEETPLLEEAKQKKKQMINTIRDEEESKPFLFNNKLFDADPLSIKRLLIAIQAAQAAISTGNSFSITWTCADNTTTDLTENDFLNLLVTMTQRGVELHERARGVKTQVDAATTVEEVNAITW